MLINLLYILFGSYLLFTLFEKRDEIHEYLHRKDDFYRYVIFVGTVILVKLCKFVFETYQLIIWTDRSINALVHRLVLRLWIQMILTAIEILCFIFAVILLTKSEFGMLIFQFQENTQLPLLLEISWIVVGIYLLNLLLIVLYNVGYLIFVIGAYIYLKCNGSSFESPCEDQIDMFEE